MLEDPPADYFDEGGAWIVAPPRGNIELDFDLHKAAKYIRDNGLDRLTQEVERDV